MTIVIDREGVVRETIEGILYADEFDQKVKPLLLNVGTVWRFSCPGTDETGGLVRT